MYAIVAGPCGNGAKERTIQCQRYIETVLLVVVPGQVITKFWQHYHVGAAACGLVQPVQTGGQVGLDIRADVKLGYRNTNILLFSHGLGFTRWAIRPLEAYVVKLWAQMTKIKSAQQMIAIIRQL